MSVYAKLAEFQANVSALTRNGTNPHFGSSYITLDALLLEIVPKLFAVGLVLTQAPSYTYVNEAAVPTLNTTLAEIEGDDAIFSSMLLLADRENPQGQGSAITYARRYALMSILGLQAEQDDDGNAGSGSAARRNTRRNSAPAEVVSNGDSSPW